jgi:hypothetical protein
MNQSSTGSLPYIRLNEMMASFMLSKAMYVASTLGIADAITEQERSTKEIANATGTNEFALARLLRYLNQRGVFHAVTPDTYIHNELSTLLKSSHPLSTIVRFIGDPVLWGAWGGIAYSLQTGAPSFEKAHAMSLWEYMQQHPEYDAVFNHAMAGLSLQAEQLIDSYDFSPFGTIVDIGGGNGTLLQTLLLRFPSSKGILFEQPTLEETARSFLATEPELSGRYTIQSGDFFQSLPQGGELYILKHILHDWNDDQVSHILANCRQVMSAGCKGIIVEQLVQPEAPSVSVLSIDMVLLALLPGHERSAEEFGTLLAQNGFSMKVIATATPYSIIEFAAL